MGLDLYCNDETVHMPYSYFFRVREAIADAIELPIYFMYGFLDTSEGKVHFTYNIHDIKDIYRVGLPINWSILKYDPLHNLISHSDCDGTLAWKVAGKIAKRLKEIQKDIRFNAFNIYEERYVELIDLCEYASKNRKGIDFC